jgi:hypothetical protein
MAQLLRAKPIPSGPPAAVRRVVDGIVALTRQLQATGLSNESMSDLIEPVFEEKLPSHLRVRWVRKRRSADTTPTLTALVDFMSEEADIPEETEAHPFAARMVATASARPATSTPPRSATRSWHRRRFKRYRSKSAAPGVPAESAARSTTSS